MTTNAPNPLRPYYIPPAHDYLRDSVTSSASEAFSRSQHIPSSIPTQSSASVFTTTARDLLSDLDYSDFAGGNGETPSARELLTTLATKASLKYTVQGLSQPFEVAMLNLQCQYIPKKSDKPRRPKNVFGPGYGKERGGRGGSSFDDFAGDDDNGHGFGRGGDDDAEIASNYSSDSEPAYFATSTTSSPGSPSYQSTAPTTTSTTTTSTSNRRRLTDRTGYVLETPATAGSQSWELSPHKPNSVWDVLKALWSKEGFFGVLKGQNASFIHWILTSTLESWSASLLSAILSIPDPASIAEISDSPYPLMSIGVAVAASAITALALAPLDAVRTKLMVTPSSDSPRTILPHLQALPAPIYLCPSPLLLPTFLVSTLPSILTNGNPYFIRTKLGIDPSSSPTTYSFLSFVGTLAARLVKLPLQTVLRRAQVDVTKPKRTIVPVGRYAGVVGTMWLIVKEEEGGWGGVEGLFRGWRMEFWPEAFVVLVSGLGGVGGAGSEGF